MVDVRAIRKLQTGYLYHYAFAMIAGRNHSAFLVARRHPAGLALING